MKVYYDHEGGNECDVQTIIDNAQDILNQEWDSQLSGCDIRGTKGYFKLLKLPT